MKYKCIEDLTPGTYLTKNKIYNIVLNIYGNDHYIETFDNPSKGHILSSSWWSTQNKFYFVENILELNKNIKII